MSAQQRNAGEFNPNNLALTRVATYNRLIRAPLERVWENVLDWEHLPWLHKNSFNFIEVDTAGDWGWRTWSNPEHTDHIELTVASEDSYVARSYVSGSQVSEIWTTLTPQDADTQVHVEFHIPDVDADSIDKLGELMTGLYTVLWDEDEAMMIERHTRLHESREIHNEMSLGNRDELVSRLVSGETLTFQLMRREYQLRHHNGELLAHSTICPHLLGPLIDSDLSSGELFCPWHGYRFNLETGDCVSPAAANCKLARPPTLSIEDGIVIATSKKSG